MKRQTLTDLEIAAADREDRENASMMNYISDSNGLIEALVEGIDVISEIDIRQALEDCIILRNGSRKSIDLSHKILGRLIAEAAINFLPKGDDQ